MTKTLLTCLLPLCLLACATPSTAVETRTVTLTPPAALTTPCDTSNRPVATVGDAVDELVTARSQRDECAAQVDALREWGRDVTVDQ